MAFEQLEDNELFFTEFEPKMQNRFYFKLADLNVPAYLIKSASRPEINFNTVELPHINITRKVKGKVSYGDVSLTLYDPISPSGSQAVMEWVLQHHEPTTGRDGYADGYKRDVVYNTLDPSGTRIEEWKLKGAFVTSASFNEAGFENDAPFEINLTLAYDYPVQNY
jgi:hypothetical protein